jgi:hypothetical protein
MASKINRITLLGQKGIDFMLPMIAQQPLLYGWRNEDIDVEGAKEQFTCFFFCVASILQLLGCGSAAHNRKNLLYFWSLPF